jgi:hypothetical protein
MSLPGYALRLSPAIMPLIAVGSALTGLASRSGAFPDFDNLTFILFATFISGIVPISVLLGVALLLADLLWPAMRSSLLVAAAGVASLILFVAYFFGRAMDF